LTPDSINWNRSGVGVWKGDSGNQRWPE